MYFILAAPHDRAHPEGTRYPDGCHDIAISGESSFSELKLKCRNVLNHFQSTYTTIFGMYSAFLFIRTGHIAAPVVAHGFCNFMGFPDFNELLNHPPRTRDGDKLKICRGTGRGTNDFQHTHTTYLFSSIRQSRLAKLKQF